MSMVPHGAPNDSLLTRFTVYQIDFSAVASGKRIATTKRRIRWCVMCAVIVIVNTYQYILPILIMTCTY